MNTMISAVPPVSTRQSVGVSPVSLRRLPQETLRFGVEKLNDSAQQESPLLPQRPKKSLLRRLLINKITVPLFTLALGSAPFAHLNWPYSSVGEVRGRWVYELLPKFWPSAYLDANGDVRNPLTRLRVGSITPEGACLNQSKTPIGQGDADGRIRVISRPGEQPGDPLARVMEDGSVVPEESNFRTPYYDYGFSSVGEVQPRNGHPAISRQQAAALASCTLREDIVRPQE